jgi:hypothetical protein
MSQHAVSNVANLVNKYQNHPVFRRLRLFLACKMVSMSADVFAGTVNLHAIYFLQKLDSCYDGPTLSDGWVRMSGSSIVRAHIAPQSTV